MAVQSNVCALQAHAEPCVSDAETVSILSADSADWSSQESSQSPSDAPRSCKAQISGIELGFLVANLIVGSGIFSTPYGFMLTGWTSIPLALLSCALSLWTALLLGDLLEAVSSSPPVDALRRGLLQDCQDTTPLEPTYSAVGERAFGRLFVPVFGAFGFGQCLLQGVYMITLSAQSWQASLGLPAKTMIFVNAAVCLCISMVPRRHFGFMAKIGVMLTVVAMLAVVCSGLWLLPQDEADTDQSLFGTEGYAGICGSIASVFLSCGDHVCFPDMYATAKNNKKTYQKGIMTGFAIFTASCLAFCVPVYLTFGTGINPNVLTNIGLGVHGEDVGFPLWVRAATNALLAFRFLFIIPCFMPNIFRLFDGILSFCLRLDLTDTTQLETICELLPENRRKFFGCFMARVLGYLLVASFAVFFEQALGALVTIVGSLFQSVNVILIPCAAYLKLCGSELQGRPIKRALLYLMLLAGTCWCVVGTTIGIMNVSKQRAL